VFLSIILSSCKFNCAVYFASECVKQLDVETAFRNGLNNVGWGIVKLCSLVHPFSLFAHVMRLCCRSSGDGCLRRVHTDTAICVQMEEAKLSAETAFENCSELARRQVCI